MSIVKPCNDLRSLCFCALPAGHGGNHWCEECDSEWDRDGRRMTQPKMLRGNHV